jgi:hypothetical protein
VKPATTRADRIFYALVGLWCLMIAGIAVVSGRHGPAGLPKPYPVAVWHRSALYAPDVSGKQALAMAHSPDARTRALADVFIAAQQVYGYRHAIPADRAAGLATLASRCAAGELAAQMTKKGTGLHRRASALAVAVATDQSSGVGDEAAKYGARLLRTYPRLSFALND